MLLFGSLVLLLSSAVVLTHQASTPESPFYTAGVVEFNPERSGQDPHLRNLEEYVNIIESAEAEDVDIIVFPESTLSSVGSIVPDPIVPFVVPCDHADEYDEIIRNLSCVARDTQKYVVVNLSEKSECTEQSQLELNDPRPCSSTGFNIYNANVVFNRQGAVISRYRKVHLFGERGKNTTLIPDISSFETDFGVTFGHFICFDLAFKVPAISLLRLGVTDIIFPTMWFSEGPFLTAVQFQQHWAYTNNVNLLAAGANNPSVGSTGTGIYNGVNGPIVSVMNFQTERKLYVAQVQKIPTAQITTYPPTPVNSPVEMSDLHLKRDQLELSNHVKLDLTKQSTSTELCYYDTCCNYDISLTVLHDLNEIEGNGQFAYGYRLIAFDGVRTYDGFATGGTFICGIVSCTDADDIWSCGWRFNKTQEVVDAVQFDSIKVSGTFRGGDDILSLPNNLGSDIMPFQLSDFIYEEDKDYSRNETIWRDIRCELKTPKSNLLSFAIYGRNFAKDGQDISEAYSAGSILKMKIELGLLSIIICLVKFLK